ncbi:MAG: DNA internalization-related competence protein ComEC/Rec2 [Desulfobulbaceae bacterium]|jgi:competence protein ComEC|nr:DNA internalization-related competence protein ComEC/Rec2 [Desulfobulbaceae bacterium]
MKVRPLSFDLITLLALAFIGGVAFSATRVWPDPTIILACALLFLAATVFARRFFSDKAAVLCLIALFGALGLHGGFVTSRPVASDALAHLPDGEEVLLFGHVAVMPTPSQRGSQSALDVVALRRWHEAQSRAAHSRVSVRLPAPWPKHYPPGAFVVLRARLDRPRAATVPGGFDHARFLAQKGIWRIAVLRGPGAIATAVDARNAWDTWPGLRYIPELLRHRIGLFLDKHLPPDAAALYRAILIGDGSRLNDEMVEAFIASGTMHIMVISGSHIALLSLLCYTVLYWLLRRFPALILRYDVKKLAWLACLPLLALYSLLAGGESPVMRAFVMCAIAVCALLFNRARAWPPLVSLTALLLLMAQPQALFTASFQLSFVTALSLCAAAGLFAPRFSKNGEKTWADTVTSWMFAALITVIAAALGAAPLTIATFQRLSLVGPLATLIIEPILSFWSLPLGFCALPLMPTQPDAAVFLLRFGESGVMAADKLARLFAAAPFASYYLAPPPWPLFVLYYVGLILFCAAFHRKKRLARLGALLVAVSILVYFSPLRDRLRPEFTDTPKIAALDVGQGSATVAHTLPGRAFLIDGGGMGGGRQSVGMSRVAPYLWRQGVRRLDVIAVSHADADHCNGLAFLLRCFEVGALWVSNPQAAGEHFQALLALARRKGVPIHIAKAGDTLRIGATQLTCLANITGDERNAGLVMRLENGDDSMLLPGDINAEMEESLLAKGLTLQSDILLAAHHGSRTSNSAAFLAAVAPRLIVVSASARRDGLFPSPELVDHCRNQRIPLVTTGENGSIFLRRLDGEPRITCLPPLSADVELGSLAPRLIPTPSTK